MLIQHLSYLTSPMAWMLHLSTGSVAFTVWPIGCGMVTMTACHFFLLSVKPTFRHKLGVREKGGKRRSIISYLHTHSERHGMETFFWCWCKETLNWKISHPPREMALWSGSAMRWSIGTHSPPTQSHDAIKHSHNQGRSIHTASVCLIYSSRGFNYSDSDSSPQTILKAFTSKYHQHCGQNTRATAEKF